MNKLPKDTEKVNLYPGPRLHCLESSSSRQDNVDESQMTSETSTSTKVDASEPEIRCSDSGIPL